MIARRNKADRPRPARSDRRGINPVIAGVLLLVGLVLLGWFGFSKNIPFRSGFELRAVVTDAVSIRPNSPVRIAGVNVGIVKRVEPYGDGSGIKRASLVVMELKDEALPVHKDATIKIRPRIFLEGNWFADLHPGSPASPDLESGDTLPITQASAPVQFDQLLTMLQSDTREDLKALLIGYGTTLTYRPQAADDVGQDPMVRGKSAARALNMSLNTAAPALRDTTIVNEALLGQNAHDLSRLIASSARVSGALGKNENALKGLVTNLNTTLGALASERDDLRRTVALLGPTVTHSIEAFAALDSALPDIRALALELIPGVKAAPATIDAATPWIAQVTKLVDQDELGGVAAQLAPTSDALASLGAENEKLLPQADLTALCLTKWAIPASDIKVDDGPFSTGIENYKEFIYTLVGFNGEAQTFDGNGYHVRFQLGGGSYAWATGPYTSGPEKPGDNAKRQWVRSNKAPLGTRPAYTNKVPPYVATKPCKDQALPNVNGKATGPADGSGPGGTPAAPYVAPAAPATAASAVQSTPKAAAGSDVAAALVDRLNPFRTEGGEGK